MKKEKIRQTDLKISELPHTRWQVFWDLVKNQKRQMISLSMLLFVFLMPLAVDILIFNQFIFSASQIEDFAAANSTVFSLIFYMLIIAIPCIVVAFIGLGGLAYVSKNIVWQEGLLIGPDFFKGIKKNIKHSIPLGIIWSVSLFVLVIGSLFLLRTSSSSDQPWIHSVGVGLCIVQFIILSIVCIYGLTYTSYYDNKFRDVLRNSFIFFVAKFFKNLLLFILTTGVIVGLMFVDFIAQFVIIIVVAFLSSYMMIGWTLLSHEAFDQLINKTNYPEYYEKGLYKEESEKEN